MEQLTVGRRERKKAATRKAIADAALRLFLERGFDQVGVKDVADAADVSTTTLFKHFESKEALLFDEDSDREAMLVATVRDRAAGQSIPQALCNQVLATWEGYLLHPRIGEFVALIHSTSALEEYARRMELRHEQALACAIAEDIGAPPDDIASAALARFALEAPHIAQAHEKPAAALKRIFELIEHGFCALAQESKSKVAAAKPAKRKTSR